MNPDLTIIEQLDFKGGTVRVNEDVSALPALKQHYLQQAKQFDDEDGKGIDAVYFSGEYPSGISNGYQPSRLKWYVQWCEFNERFGIREKYRSCTSRVLVK